MRRMEFNPINFQLVKKLFFDHSQKSQNLAARISPRLFVFDDASVKSADAKYFEPAVLG